MFQEELQRVLASKALRGSDSLRRLLQHLGQAYLDGNDRSLKEYSIGRDVMGKPEDYDPRVDSSVRVQIGKLRKRLDQYYVEEAPGSLVEIRIPKGQFSLLLVERKRPRNPWWIWGAVAAGIVVVGLGVWRVWPRASLGPELEEFWGPFLQSKRPLIVVLGSPLFVRFHSSYFRDPQVNDWSQAEKMLRLSEMERLLESPTPAQETHRWTPFGESAAAFRLAVLLGGRRPDIVMKRSTVLAWEDVRTSNLVFLGPMKFNPQLKDLPLPVNFMVEAGAVTNRKPRAGELNVYRKPSPPQEEEIPEEYAVITRLAPRAGWGEVLVLESTSTEGTWAAADYVTHAATLAQMRARLNRGGKAPADYQVLLRGRFKNQVPIAVEYVTHHVLGH